MPLDLGERKKKTGWEEEGGGPLADINVLPVLFRCLYAFIYISYTKAIHYQSFHYPLCTCKSNAASLEGQREEVLVQLQ